MQASRYLEGLMTGWLCGKDLPAPPKSMMLALSSEDPNDRATALVEPQSTSYHRLPVQFNAPLSNDSHSLIANAEGLVFQGSFGKVSHVGLFDEADNLYFHGELKAIRNVVENDTLSFHKGDIRAHFEGALSQYTTEAVLNFLRGETMPAAPRAVALALLVADPGYAGKTFETPRDTGYETLPVVFEGATDLAVASSMLYNRDDLIFGPAKDRWGVITHAALVDHDDARFLARSPLLVPRHIAPGEGFGLGGGALIFGIN